MSLRQGIEEHYGRDRLGERVLAALEQAGTDLTDPSFETLPPIDEFHIRGREATAELARLAHLSPTTKVLDAGSGIGGSTRFLASHHGCAVTGVDLTGAYCTAARLLSRTLRLEGQTRYVQGSATHLPIADGGVDVVWTQHAQMNIPAKRRFYAELVRVLKPGGQLLFHDIFAGDGGALTFPVPWAERAEISHLATPAEVVSILRDSGLRQTAWHDLTEESAQWARQMAQQDTDPAAATVRALIMGADGPLKMANLAQGLAQNRVVVIQARYDKPIP